MEIEVVELTADEKKLCDSICWDSEAFLRQEYEPRIEQLNNMGLLVESLLERSAIPQVRLDFFAEPEMNVPSGTSRQQTFERNGTSGKAILRHPHFMKYARYFIFGPDLPKTTIAGFCKIIDDDQGTSGEVLTQLTTFVRKKVRERGQSSAAADAEAFFQLAHEIEKPDLARPVWDAAKKAVRR